MEILNSSLWADETSFLKSTPNFWTVNTDWDSEQRVTQSREQWNICETFYIIINILVSSVYPVPPPYITSPNKISWESIELQCVLQFNELFYLKRSRRIWFNIWQSDQIRSQKDVKTLEMEGRVGVRCGCPCILKQIILYTTYIKQKQHDIKIRSYPK